MQYVSWLKCAYIFSIQKMFSAVCFIKFFQGNWSIAITVDVNFFNCVAFPTRCMSASAIDVLITGQFSQRCGQSSHGLVNCPKRLMENLEYIIALNLLLES